MQMNRRNFVAAFGAGLALGATSRLSLAQDSGPIRIGALNPVTGAGSPYGTGMQKMILAAAETVNAAGGAAGRQIQVFAEDSQTNPQAARARGEEADRGQQRAGHPRHLVVGRDARGAAAVPRGQHPDPAHLRRARPVRPQRHRRARLSLPHAERPHRALLCRDVQEGRLQARRHHGVQQCLGPRTDRGLRQGLEGHGQRHRREGRLRAEPDRAIAPS